MTGITDKSEKPVDLRQVHSLFCILLGDGPQMWRKHVKLKSQPPRNKQRHSAPQPSAKRTVQDAESVFGPQRHFAPDVQTGHRRHWGTAVVQNGFAPSPVTPVPATEVAVLDLLLFLA
jgi:hypothetical protein